MDVTNARDAFTIRKIWTYLDNHHWPGPRGYSGPDLTRDGTNRIYYQQFTMENKVVVPRVCSAGFTGCSCQEDWRRIRVRAQLRCHSANHRRRVDGATCGEFAEGKPTTQSTTDWGGSASRAVDGNTDQNYHHGSCTCTKNGGNEWWRVDLQQVVDVQSVQIWNRKDCCKDRINGARIVVGNSLDHHQGKVCAVLDSISDSRIYSCVASGRYVFVVNSAGEHLTLCEVKVFGTPHDVVAARKQAQAEESFDVAQAHARAVLRAMLAGRRLEVAERRLEVEEEPVLEVLEVAERRLEVEEEPVLKGLAAGETEVTSEATTHQLP